MKVTNDLKEINRALKDCGIKIVGSIKARPKIEIESMVELIERAFCFNDRKGNEGVVKEGEHLIAFIKKQDKIIKKYKEKENEKDTDTIQEKF